MLRPDYIEKLPNEIVKQFLILEEQVIFDISEKLNKNLRLSESDEHRIKALMNMGYDAEEIEKAINKQINIAAKHTEQLMFDIAKVSYETDQKLYRQGGKELIDLEDNIPMKEFINQAARESKDRILNLTGSTGFAHNRQVIDVRQFYIDTLNQGFLQVSTGLYDHNVAIRQAVNTICDRGLVAIDVQHKRIWDIESHVRTSIMTGVNQITGYMSEANADMMGQDLMEITAHIGARPSHADWQGQIVDREGRGDYLSLDDIQYGDAAGFKGTNCRHDWFPHFEGISERAYTEKDLDNIDPPDFEYDDKTYTAYEATQRQRYYERNMRKVKRRIIAADAIDDDIFTAESIRLRRLREEYKEFSQAAGLRQKHERHFTYNYDRSIAAKARWRG